MNIKNSLLFFCFVVVSIISAIVVLVLHFFIINNNTNTPLVTHTDDGAPQNVCQKQELVRYGLTTPTCQKNIDLNLVLRGAGKDSIPAIHSPKFVPYEQSTMPDNARGIFIDIDGVQRFYPYNILVWHEIVNDNINDTHYAVTFCPLCETGIVMNRTIHNQVLVFGVSGLLYESNLLMYDTHTESLWSQARQKAVIGPYTGTDLEILPFQLLRFSEVKQRYPDGVILSTNTGYNRNYLSTPYGGYLDNPDTLFPISISDRRFPAKELFYVVPFYETSVAFPYHQLATGSSVFTVDGKRNNYHKRKWRNTHNAQQQKLSGIL